MNLQNGRWERRCSEEHRLYGFNRTGLVSFQLEFVVGDVKAVIHFPFLENRVFASAVEKMDGFAWYSQNVCCR
jgi:hypothetical protein